MTTPKRGHGGRRPNSGRRKIPAKLKKTSITITVMPEIEQFIRAIGNAETEAIIRRSKKFRERNKCEN